jgi:hypothetical protein
VRALQPVRRLSDPGAGVMLACVLAWLMTQAIVTLRDYLGRWRNYCGAGREDCMSKARCIDLAGDPTPASRSHSGGAAHHDAQVRI